MLYCCGAACPLRDDCYRYTQPSPRRDRFASMPFDAVTGTCDWFQTNQPSEKAIREAAYYIWLREGCPQNRCEQHWQEAYQTLCRSLGKVNR